MITTPSRADPLIAPELQQALFQLFGQRRGSDVETQVDRIRHLVDVLAAGTLRSHGSDLDFLRAQFEAWARHRTSACTPSTSLAGIQGAVLASRRARAALSVRRLRS
jgi:hypothetical protein